MDRSTFDSLNVADFPRLKESLNKCKNYDEAWGILKKFEKEIDKDIEESKKNGAEQELLEELHRYNEIKDMTQAVIGSLAALQGVTCAKIHEQYDLMTD